MKITAALLETSGSVGPCAETRPLRLAMLDLAAPEPGELLIRTDAAGLCHSDLSVVNGDRPRPMPMALGHDATGIVVASGGGTPNHAPGDRVVLAFLPSCGHCVACASGEGYLCAEAAAPALYRAVEIGPLAGRTAAEQHGRTFRYQWLARRIGERPRCAAGDVVLDGVAPTLHRLQTA